MHSRTSTIIGVIGRTLISLGLIILLFAGYQLWGTGLQEQRSQNSLEKEFEERQASLAALESTRPTTTSPPTTASRIDEPDSIEVTTTAPPMTVPVSIAPEIARELLSARGESMGFIRIPSIGVEKVVVEGVGREDLRKGPGHYPNTPYPGQAGNAAIAGHRTTYGQPFHNLDRVQPGDMIEVETLQGNFFYEVEAHENEDGTESGHFIVDPSQVDVVEDKGDNRLTLTACHPKFSARQRIIVTAVMVGAPAPALPILADLAPGDADVAAGAETAVDGLGADEELAAATEDEANTVGFEVEENALDGALGWHTEELPSVLIWVALDLLVILAGWLFGRAWKKMPAYFLAAPLFLVVLFFTFGHLDRMLPAI
jgi:sortase A